MPTTIATSRARYDIDRHASFFQQCAGMAFLMSARVKGGGAARPFPVCRTTKDSLNTCNNQSAGLKFGNRVSGSGARHLPGTLPETT